MSTSYSDIFDAGRQACTQDTSFYMDLYIKPWIYGNIFGGMLYGAIVLISIAYIRILFVHIKRKKPLTTQQRILSTYVVVAFVLSTLQISGALQITNKYLYKFGCTTSVVDKISGPTSWLENVCFMISAWTVDVIMMWRFLIIYYDLKRTKWSIFVFSLLIQTASVGMGIYTAIVMSYFIMGLDPFNGNFYLVFFEAITLFHNIMLTTLIVGRLLLCRRRIQNVLGRCYGNEYISIASMVVESQSLLGIAQVTMLASLIQTNANSVELDPGFNKYGPTFFQVTGQVQTIAQITQLRFKNDEDPEPKSAV
ncbi:hypothetical protein BDQ17DRAFT_1330418 [Cyathus striatus]|nr:hypothetical protein BDQ17DRAFT_1330418 [Cyathus striatus]